MNITNSGAGSVSHEHIIAKGFRVYTTIDGNDMGQSSWSIPQYTNDKFTIEGGYWRWDIYDKSRYRVFTGWWNSNEEFDITIAGIKDL